MRSKTVWMIIYDHLKAEGFDVYAPAQHVGQCKTPYVVLKTAGSARFGENSSTATVMDILCYVPGSSFSLLEGYVETVKGSMKKLRATIQISPEYSETPSFYDDVINGHMISAQYVVYRKI